MCFSALRSFLHLVWSCFLYSYHAFHFFLHNFWDFLKNLGFLKIDEFSTIFWVGFCLNDFKCSCIPLPLHFNHIFMHYRCVLYMLNCCVLLGLDWANPMMLLMLYITCKCCISHANAYSYIDLFVAFLCVFLSPSLFLALVCFMASKRKSTLSWNLLCSRAFSSFSSLYDPTSSHIRFCDDKALKDFSENFSWRDIHSECQVVL